MTGKSCPKSVISLLLLVIFIQMVPLAFGAAELLFYRQH